MSWVTNVLLSVSVFETRAGGAMDDLQKRLEAGDIGPLGSLSDTRESPEHRWGGTKFAEVSLFGAGYNFLNLEAFMTLVLESPWEYPRLVQLFVKNQERFRFSIYEIDPVNRKWCLVLDRLADIDFETGELI